MSCEGNRTPFYTRSLIDGAVEEVCFKSVKEILAQVPQLSRIESKSANPLTKRPFVPFLTDVNMTGL